jgi:putative proteasome-type protease
MTYCLSIMTREGLVMASDSRTNAGYDDLNVVRKMHTFVEPDERVFVILVSGSLSLSQSVMNLLRAGFDAGEGLAQVKTMYEAAREVGRAVRQVSEMDREALERDKYDFNVHLLIGGQVRGEDPQTFLIYPQGNPLSSTEDSPYLQLGEYKYGRPILDRGIVYESTSLKAAAKYALLSFDATMRSNVSVGPPIEILLYKRDSFQIDNYRRLKDDDRELTAIHTLWERSLRNAVEDLPDLSFEPHPAHKEQGVLL